MRYFALCGALRNGLLENLRLRRHLGKCKSLTHRMTLRFGGQHEMWHYDNYKNLRTITKSHEKPRKTFKQQRTSTIS